MLHPVYIRPLKHSDAEDFLAAIKRSQDIHTPWVSPPNNKTAFTHYHNKGLQETHFRYLVCTQEGDIAGLININEVVRGAFQSGYLGFYSVHPHAGQGLMSAGLKLLLQEAFQNLHLHRLEANIQPANIASINLVKNNGFRKEGFSPRYLKINDSWQDHERWAITCEEFNPEESVHSS